MVSLESVVLLICAGKPFIWCTLHNFGGAVGLYGMLPNISTGPLECLQQSCGMVGVGTTMEGINQNYGTSQAGHDTAEFGAVDNLRHPQWYMI